MKIDKRLISWYRLYLFGRLIPGVSHEVDNNLSVALGYSELIISNPMDELKRLELMNNIVNSTSNISWIMKKYSYFAGEQQEEDTLFEINETIHEIITFAGYQLRKNGVGLNIDLPDEGLFLHGGRKDFALMLLNIMVNASESMADGGGCQTLAVSRDTDGTIEITVSDEGVGVRAELSEMIFKAGFTTKGESYRLGLGLPVSRQLAKRFGASIYVSSEYKKGTQFTIAIPKTGEQRQ